MGPSEQHRPPAHSLAPSGSPGGSKLVLLKMQFPVQIDGPPLPGGRALRRAQCLWLPLSWATRGSVGVVYTGLGPQQPPTNLSSGYQGPTRHRSCPQTVLVLIIQGLALQDPAVWTPKRHVTHVQAYKHPRTHIGANCHCHAQNEHCPRTGPSSKLDQMTWCPPGQWKTPSREEPSHPGLFGGLQEKQLRGPQGEASG